METDVYTDVYTVVTDFALAVFVAYVSSFILMQMFSDSVESGVVLLVMANDQKLAFSFLSLPDPWSIFRTFMASWLCHGVKIDCAGMKSSISSIGAHFNDKKQRRARPPPALP